MFSRQCAAAVALLAAAPLLAQAQQSPVKTQAPHLTYSSAFESYRSFNEEPVRSWREANDNVGRIGGWRVYAREAAPQGSTGQAGARGTDAPSSQPAAAAPGQNPGSAAPEAGGHKHH